MKAVDGNEATANIAYAFNDVSFIYPITPATPMGEWVDQWSNEGRINLHNNVMEVRAAYSHMQAGMLTAECGAAQPGSSWCCT
jgi:pyruvate-ferredoxin/flavodoxin oxidoreductase